MVDIMAGQAGNSAAERIARILTMEWNARPDLVDGILLALAAAAEAQPRHDPGRVAAIRRQIENQHPTLGERFEQIKRRELGIDEATVTAIARAPAEVFVDAVDALPDDLLDAAVAYITQRKNRS